MFMEFLRMWGDKCLMVFLFIFVMSIAILAYHMKELDLQSTALDLAKQILAGLLTLLVAAKAGAAAYLNGKNGSATSTTTTTDSTSTH